MRGMREGLWGKRSGERDAGGTVGKRSNEEDIWWNCGERDPVRGMRKPVVTISPIELKTTKISTAAEKTQCLLRLGVCPEPSSRGWVQHC